MKCLYPAQCPAGEQEKDSILSLRPPTILQYFLTGISPNPCSPESQRLEDPQDGKAAPVEEWAEQSPPELVLLGSQALAVLWVQRETKEG